MFAARPSEAAVVEPVGAAVESTSTAAPTAAASTTVPTSAATPPCQRVGRARESNCSRQGQHSQRNSACDARSYNDLHGYDPLTFRNSIRLASLGRSAWNLLLEICFGNFQLESTAMSSGDPGTVR